MSVSEKKQAENFCCKVQVLYSPLPVVPPLWAENFLVKLA